MSGEQIDSVQEECRKATEKAMNLLLQQDRTKKELQDRLYRAGFSERASAYAMEYAMGFGYIDDLRYAENYISFHKERRSRKEMCYKLQSKGVEADVLALAFETYEVKDEQIALVHLLKKRLKEKKLTDMDYSDKNKVTAYLARKGFPLPAVRRAMNEMQQHEEENESIGERIDWLR